MLNGTCACSQAQRVGLAQSAIEKHDQNSAVENMIEKCDSKVQFRSAIE